MSSLTRQDFAEIFKDAAIAGGVIATTLTAIGNYKLILPATLFAVTGAVTTSTRHIIKEKQTFGSSENKTPSLS
jgi:hypothetical protein